MADTPKLKDVSVLVKFKTTSGFRSEALYSTKNSRLDGTKSKPERVITEVVDELARIAALDGYGDKVVEAAQDACRRVADWEKNHG